MKTLQLHEMPGELRALLEAARDEGVVLQLEDGSEFLLVSMDLLQGQAETSLPPTLAELLRRRAQAAGVEPTYSLSEVRARLGLE